MRRTALLVALGIGATIEAALAAPAQISGQPKVYFRRGPGPEHAPVGILEAGQRVETGATEGSWTEITLPDGRTGWVFRGFLGALSPEEAASAPPVPATAAPSEPAAAPQVQADAPAPPEAPAGGAAEEEQEIPVAPVPLGEEAGDVSAELGELRREVQELRSRVASSAAQPSPTASPAIVAPTAAQPAPLPPADPGAAALGIAVFSFVVGWVFGSMFSRRKRAQRSRLRF